MGYVWFLPIPLLKLTIPKMTRETIKKLIKTIPFIATSAFILKLPMFHWTVTNLGDLISTALFLSYSSLAWKYYASLPAQKKTVLTLLVQDFVLLLSVFRILHMIRYNAS